MRITKARTAILDVFQHFKNPLDAQEIFAILERNNIDIDLATVYRTVAMFTDKNIIHAVDFADGITRYELSSLPHHHHAICTNCGKIQDVKICDDLSVQVEIKKSLKFEVKSHKTEFFGLCFDCK